jgi:hypothetical protein
MGAKRKWALVLVAGVGLALTGCGATDSEGARDTAERLYLAYSDDDGAAACATLSDDTREQLVEDEQFLEETGDGWRVTAAGCRPAPGREAPYDCEVDS